MRPHREILEKLIKSPTTVDPNRVPAMQWQQKEKKNRGRPWYTAVIFAGHVSVCDMAEINNWIDTQIPGAGTTCGRTRWAGTGTLPLAHARTLLLAHRYAEAIRLLKDFPQGSDEATQQQFGLKCAWKMLGDERREPVDVDREAVADLEAAMFAETPKVTYRQWGTGAGAHQDDWDPYPPK